MTSPSNGAILPVEGAIVSGNSTINECGTHYEGGHLQSNDAPHLQSPPKHLCIDLCSGLGGFSSAFLSDSNWEVVTLDINPKFKPTVVASVTHLPFKKDLHPDVVLASPPCERFSLGCRMFPKEGIRKALEIVGACLEAIAYLRPKNWVLENPKGRLRWFIGNPAQSIKQSDFGGKYQKPTDLWGTVQLPLIRAQMPFEPSWSSVKNCGKGSSGLLRLRDPAKRALIPYGVSQAVKRGVEGS